MDFLISMGINWIVAIQSLGGWLEAPMKFLSFFGSQDFFFLVLPLIYWCIDASLGLRVGFILITSASLNGIVKLMFAGPRPYWASARVIPYAADDPLFGLPSGHAQNAVAVWGIIASRIRKPWAWGAAIALAFLIGFSRLYLGMHFPHDVFVGWLLGALVLWAFIRFADLITARVRSQTLSVQASTIFIVSLLVIGLGMLSAIHLNGYILPEEWKTNALRTGTLPDPVSIEGFISLAGTFFGLALGAVWMATQGGYQASGPVWKRALRYVVGLIGILIFWRGLALFLPDHADLISHIFRYLRYSLVGFWVSAGAPWLFFRFKLAEMPKM